MDFTNKDIILIVISIISFVFAVFQFITKQTSTHNKEVLMDHSIGINENTTDIKNLDIRLTETREALHKDYLSKSDFQVFDSQLRKLFHSIDNINKVLNQLVGETHAKRK